MVKTFFIYSRCCSVTVENYYGDLDQYELHKNKLRKFRLPCTIFRIQNDLKFNTIFT